MQKINPIRKLAIIGALHREAMKKWLSEEVEARLAIRKLKEIGLISTSSVSLQRNDTTK